jgi:cell division transport system ATP-binding protein
MGSDLLVRLENVEVCQEENVILSDVSLILNRGEFVYLIGKVGSGKSSLLKALYGEISIRKGKACVAGYDLRKIRSRKIPFLRRKLGIVFQDFQLLTDRSAIKNLEFVLKATGWKNKSEINRRIGEVLEQVGMPNKGYKMPHELSGGEQQRLAIARALLNTPEIILADEPTGNLDPETSGQIVQLLHDIRSLKGTAIIMTTHNYNIVKAFPARVVKCRNNGLYDVEQGTLPEPDCEDMDYDMENINNNLNIEEK